MTSLKDTRETRTVGGEGATGYKRTRTRSERQLGTSSYSWTTGVSLTLAEEEAEHEEASAKGETMCPMLWNLNCTGRREC